jgi:DNA segregation ATPase FtsK/SpoIIIE, S-DNA-T family
MRAKLSKPRNRSSNANVVMGLFYITFATIFCMMLFSYSPNDPSLTNATKNIPTNLLGISGSYGADLLLQTFGFASGLFIVLPMAWGIQNILKQKINFFWIRFIFALISIVAFASVLVKYKIGKAFLPYGGAVGNIINIYTANFNDQYVLFAEAAILAISLYIALNIHIKSIALFLWGMMCYTGKALVYINNALLCPIGRTIKMIITKFIQNKEEESKIEIKESDSKKTNTDANSKKEIIESNYTQLLRDFSFSIPCSSLLNNVRRTKITACSEKFLQNTAQELIKVLNDFGVNGQIVSCSPGPVVTLYEFEPAPGVKSSRVIGLSDDIARTMRAISTRISIIPGKNSLGIELPNKERETVYLRETIESKEYRKGCHKLPLVLGKDIAGDAVIVDLTSMPHLLVAGTTGSGKSVAINTMILSILFRYTPEECKFVMIDPKMLELSIYEGIPHLLAPVVTESNKAVVALKWTVKEMENRYRLMSHLNVRNVEGYNKRVEEAIEKGTTISKKIQTGFDSETGKPIYETIDIENKKLPFIIVIVDEMADLMIVAGKEIESSIQRLAQMARAAGIHLIMATQRPSVDVITGVIKANFPTRISFQVTSKIDSRTILGEMGAEQLLGKGDMLYMSGGNKIKRIHGPFVADSEVERVVLFLKSQGSPAYSVDITTEPTGNSISDSDEKDELYDKAVTMVLRERKASTSFLQRCFKIGYNRAASIIEQMEKEGVIGQPNHVGKREILVNN